MNRRKYSVAGVAMAVTWSIVLVACSSGSDGPGSSGAENTLTIAEPGAPTTMDPRKLTNGAGNIDYASLAYDPLIRYTPEGKWVPDLATSWDLADGNKTFTVHLREKVKFSDGTTMTADDVVNTIKAEQGSGTTCASYLGSLVSVKATDPLTVVMKFSDPQPAVLATFDQQGMCGDIVGKGVTGTTTNGTGPYMLDASQTLTGSTYVYKQNPNYWNTGLKRFDKVTLKFIANSNSAFNALRDGQVDVITGDSTEVDAAKKAKFGVYAAPSGGQYLWLVDFGGKDVPALKDQRVRQAIAYAIDNSRMAKAIYGNYARPSDASVAVKGYQGYADGYDDYYAYDPDKAKQLLAEAGYANGFVLPMMASRDMGFDPSVQAIASYLAKVNINVNIKEYPSHNEAVTQLTSGKMPSFVWGYGAHPLPVTATGIFGEKALFNPYHNPQPEIVKMINKANTLSGDAADKAYADAEIYAIKQAWTIGLFETYDITFARPGKIANIGLGPDYPGGVVREIGYWSPAAT